MSRGQYYRWDKKHTTDDALELTTKYLGPRLNRAMDRDRQGPVERGSLSWTRINTGEEISSVGYVIERDGPLCFVRFHYTTTRWNGEKIKSNYRVQMVYTVPNYGGRRWWFICPLMKGGRACNRRVGKLYIPPGALLFGCRHCRDLTYKTSQSGDLMETIDNRLLAIRRKLKAQGHFLDPPRDKPRGMHWDTYSRLCREFWNLMAMRDRAFTYGAIKILGGLEHILAEEDSRLAAMLTAEDYHQDLREDWKHHKAQPDRVPERWSRLAREWAARAEEEDEEEDKRGTLGEIARTAGVPFDFAREAERERLIRADGGRGTRRRRYRRRLSTPIHTSNCTGRMSVLSG